MLDIPLTNKIALFREDFYWCIFNERKSALGRVFSYLFGIDGRISVAAFYWRAFLGCVIPLPVWATIVELVEYPESKIHFWPFVFTTVVIGTQVIRRFHDSGMSAWHPVAYFHVPLAVLSLSAAFYGSPGKLVLVPFGFLILWGLIALFYSPADKFDNSYGPARHSHMDALLKVPGDFDT